MEDHRPVIDIVRARMPPRLYEIEREFKVVNRNVSGLLITYNQPTLRALWLEKQKLKKQLVREIRAEYPLGIKQPGSIMECVLEEYKQNL